MQNFEEALEPLWTLRRLLHVDGNAEIMVSQTEVGEMLERLLLQVETELAGG